MRRSVLLALACLAALVIAPLSAQAQTLMQHNGSVMMTYFNGGAISIYYEAPREGIRDVGVRQGTLLFNGQTAPYGQTGEEVWGTARIFKAGCSPATYSVEGFYNYATGDITLYGIAPVFVSGNSCRISHYAYNSNSTLVFTEYGPPPH